MNLILRISASLSLWVVVASMVWWVDPELVRDYPIPGLYLPFLAIFWIACWQSLEWVIKKWSVRLLGATGVTILIGCLLIL